jgi:hypothetical protein
MLHNYFLILLYGVIVWDGMGFERSENDSQSEFSRLLAHTFLF